VDSFISAEPFIKFVIGATPYKRVFASEEECWNKSLTENSNETMFTYCERIKIFGTIYSDNVTNVTILPAEFKLRS